MLKPNGARAVMASCKEPPEALQDFPTPPWATRALFEIVFKAMGLDLRKATVWEPACNRGLMAEVIREYVWSVYASDVMDYGYRPTTVASYVGQGPDVHPALKPSPLVITNPPFPLAVEFLLRALSENAPLVALLLPTRWVEGETRYFDVFEKFPPTIIAYFVERVPIHKGRWDPNGDTATAYSWYVWKRRAERLPPLWIPPGQRTLLTRDYDVKRAYELGALGEEAGPLL